MKTLLRIISLAFVLSTGTAVAQWTTETYQLQPGWNGIHALNDPSHVNLDTLLSAYPDVTQVWRWVPTDLTAQFIANPNEVVEGAEWRTWLRGDPGNSSMSAMLPNHGYLVFLEGATNQTISITGRAILDRVNWRSSGANLVGFPTDPSDAPEFASYFAPFAGFDPLTTNVYQYVGGAINASNPAQVFNLNQSTIKRGKAYWMELETYSDFVSPVKVQISSGTDGMHFGTRGGPQDILVTNLSDAEVTVSLATMASVPAPAGETTITGQVPLLQKVWDPTNQVYNYVPVTAPLTTTLAAGAGARWTLVPDRVAMAAPEGSLYASILKVTDSGAHGSYAQQCVPISAEKTGLSGLWVGEARVTQVQNQLQRFERNADGSNVGDEDGQYVLLSAENSVTETAQSFPLRLIVHVDEAGSARLLSNVYHGILDTTPASLGFAVRQDLLRATDLSKATRITATHLPLDTNEALVGAFEPGGQSAATVSLPYDDPVNPFVHTYHPDHDNLDARFSSTPLGAGIESHTVNRSITFTVDTESPTSDPTWGTVSLTGTYAETITGLHKQSIAVGGTFALRRLSEVSVLSQ